MRYLYIVRHAKSSWSNISLPDFERPLNDRGKKDAPEMAKRLLKRKIKIDAFVSSPAKRAKKTAKSFCEEYKIPAKKIILDNNLYEASKETFYEVVSNFHDTNKSVALFSHNPGITEFVNSLISDVKIDNMPTCGIFGVEINSGKWKEFMDAQKKFLFFDYPKKL